jgi:hypothetical protein
MDTPSPCLATHGTHRTMPATAAPGSIIMHVSHHFIENNSLYLLITAPDIFS